MTFWTTPPHFLMVATLNETGIGIDSCFNSEESLVEYDNCFKSEEPFVGYDIRFQSEEEVIGCDNCPSSKESLVGNGNCFKSKEKVVGIIATQRSTDKICELNRLSVSGKLNGLGIGKSLLKTAVDRAKELGYDQVYLETSDIHKSAICIYEKFGFQLQGSFAPQLDFMNLSVPQCFHGIKIRTYLYKIKSH